MIYRVYLSLLIKPPAVGGFHSRSLGNPSASAKVLRDMKGLVKELILDLIFEDDCPLNYCLISEEEEIIRGKND